MTNLKPDKRNANKGTARGRELLLNSLRELGAGRSILADKDGNLIAGNKTFNAAAELGLPVRVVETNGDELVVVKRNDLDLNDKTGKARQLAGVDHLQFRHELAARGVTVHLEPDDIDSDLSAIEAALPA